MDAAVQLPVRTSTPAAQLLLNSDDTAALAHADLLALRVELFPYEPFGKRVWDLRTNVTAYDGWYVALAEMLGARLATLDSRLTRAKGPRCAFTIPPG